MGSNTPSPRVILSEYGIPNANEYSNLKLAGPWSIEKLKQKIKIKIVKLSEDKRELEFDIIGCSHALANSYRRIMLSEIPTMAIEKVFMLLNTSLIQDEVLAHRLGLLPLKANPMLFEYPTNLSDDNEEISEQDTLRYQLKIACTMNPNPPKDSQKPEEIYKNSNVYSSNVKWIPINPAANMHLNGEEEFGMLEDKILICKMKPGQEIHAYMHAVKGIGKDHAKFSPVATATYRLLPDIQLTKPVRGNDAELLQKCFSPGVIDLVRHKKNCLEAKVNDARYDSCSRNVYRFEQLKDSVELGRVSDHFIFTVESVGAIAPNQIFLDAVKVLRGKCQYFLEELDNIS